MKKIKLFFLKLRYKKKVVNALVKAIEYVLAGKFMCPSILMALHMYKYTGINYTILSKFGFNLEEFREFVSKNYPNSVQFVSPCLGIWFYKENDRYANIEIRVAFLCHLIKNILNDEIPN